MNLNHNFTGSIPGNYDHYLRPLIFDPYAEDLAVRIEKLRHKDILETAAGTGVVTALLAKSLREGDKLVVTDINPAMLEIAKKAIVNPAIIFQLADATSLPFEDSSFDMVVTQFGVMFFPDKLQGYREAFRMLRRGGTFLFNVWDKLELNELAALSNATVGEMFPHSPPSFMAATPHGYHDVEDIKSALTKAGFENVTAEILPKRSRAPSAREPAMAYCQGTPMRAEIETRDATKLELATDLCEKAIMEKFGTRAIDAAIQAIVFTALRN